MVFPFYVADGVIGDLWKILLYLNGKSGPPEENGDLLKLAMFCSLMCYVFITILANQKKKIRSRFRRLFEESKLSGDENVEKVIGKLKEIINIILKSVITNFRYVPLFFSLLASLVTVNILNAFLLLLTLGFAWNTKNDHKYWIYYLYYNTLFIPLLYFSNLVPSSLPSFNIELISIIGVYGGIDSVYRKKMSLHYLAAMSSSVYLYLISYLPQLAEKKKLREKEKAEELQSLLQKRPRTTSDNNPFGPRGSIFENGPIELK